MAYGSAALTTDEAQLLGGACDGLVLAGKKGFELARSLRGRGFTGLIATDPVRYLETDTPQSTLDVSVDEVTQQTASSPDFLVSDARSCIAAGDVAGLRAEIENGNRFCDTARQRGRHALLCLVLDGAWLTDDLGPLKKLIRQARHPLALVLSDPKDPLHRQRAVTGLVDVLVAFPGTALLRTDLAGIGGLAYGASLAALGLSTTLRHAVPPGMPAGGSRRDRSLRVLHRQLLSFFKGSIIFRIGHRSDLFVCDCLACDGQSLSRFRDPERRAEANLHNVLVWNEIAEEILRLPLDDRPQVWSDLCATAVELSKKLPRLTKTTALEISPQVAQWADVVC